MRTSGGRGAEGWIMAIPVVALLIVASLSSGGVDGMFITLERTLRHTFTAVVDALRGLF